MKCKSYESFFQNLANKTKFDIIMTLRESPLSVTEIANKLNEEQSKVSHNLKSLSSCHILDVKQEGKKRIYSLNKETIIPILTIIGKHVEKYCPRRCHK